MRADQPIQVGAILNQTKSDLAQVRNLHKLHWASLGFIEKLRERFVQGVQIGLNLGHGHLRER